MKNVSKILMFLLIGGLMSGALFLNSCSKDDVSKIDEVSAPTDILSFENDKEYNDELKRVLLMKSSELKAYEESKGYKSFGRKCDEVYNNVISEDFKSTGEIDAFVAKNSEYLQWIKDANGELTMETVLYKSGNRYLINTDRMYIIDKTVYKVFEKGIASTNIENFGKLKNIDEYSFNSKNEISDINYNYSNITSYFKSSISTEYWNDNGNNRIYITMAVYTMNVYGPNNTQLRLSYLIKPYKKTLGRWYGCTRTVSASLNLKIEYRAGGMPAQIASYYGVRSPVLVNEIKDDVFLANALDGYIITPTYSFYAYDYWGSSASGCFVQLLLNEGEL